MPALLSMSALTTAKVRRSAPANRNCPAANSHGFCSGYKGSAHYIGCAMVATDGDNMERDDWYTSHRVPNALEAAEAVGRIAGERAVARLNPRKTGAARAHQCMLTPQIAGGFIGHAISALFGGSLYRKTSFLLDSIGKPVFAPLVDIVDDPFIAQAYASSPFDQEGVTCQRRSIIEKGVVRATFSAYSARKLGMQSTGNAGGNHNLLVTPTMRAIPLCWPDKWGAVCRHRADGAGRQSSDWRLFARAAGFWSRAARSPIRCRDHHRRQPARSVPAHRRIGDDIDRRGSKTGGPAADRVDADRRYLTTY